MKKKSSKAKKNVHVWTWRADFGKGMELCRFAEATRKNLVDRGRPTPRAIPVRVVMGNLR